MKKRGLLVVSIISLLFILSTLGFCTGCNLFQSECEKNNTGTLTVKNNTNDDIKVRIDGISYGFLSRGETLKKSFAAGVKYTVETLWPDGSPACAAAEVTVVKCEQRGIVCSAVH